MALRMLDALQLKKDVTHAWCQAAFVFLFLNTLLGGCAKQADPVQQPSSAQPTIAATSPPYSIKDFFQHCEPRPDSGCGNPLPCEGKSVVVRGFIDPVNVFDRATYPLLPYEKFLIVDRESRLHLEVFVLGDDSLEIFRKVRSLTSPSSRATQIDAVTRGYDAPTMESCRRGVHLEIRSASNISVSSHRQE